MEKRLTTLHKEGIKFRLWEKFVVFIAGVSFVFLLPYIHLGEKEFVPVLLFTYSKQFNHFVS